MFPYLIRAYFETRNIFSPVGLLTEALNRFGKSSEQEGILKQQQALKSMLHDIQDFKISPEGQGKISLNLSKASLLEFAGDYLKRVFFQEGAQSARFAKVPRPSFEKDEADFDGVLTLPYRCIYAKLLKDEPTPEVLTEWLRVAKHLTPSEVWLLTSKDPSFELDLRLEPSFLDENRVMFGRLKLLSLSTLFYEILGKNFKVTIDQRHKEDDSVRLILEKESTKPIINCEIGTSAEP
jgi:hypothetical protein